MKLDIVICSILVVITLAAYLPMGRNDFVLSDDLTAVVENPQVTGGLTWPGLQWAFTTRLLGNWQPLTWLSLMLDCQLAGPNPVWIHFHNLLLHVIGALLLYLVLRRMTGAAWASALVAALFAVHPAHVESVAWAAQRKDVLSGVFWMLTMWAYLRYAARPSIGRYVPVFIFLALGLMAKPMLVTLPLVLLLLDFWPLGRMGAKRPSDDRVVAAATTLHSIGRLVLEKVPLFALAAAASAVALLVQGEAGALVSPEVISPALRLEYAPVAYVAYVVKMFYPAGLAVFYSFPQSIPVWQWAGALAILAGITAAAVRFGRQQPYLAVGWLWFLGTLVPVIGLVKVGLQSMADRYTYVPYIGLFIMVAWGIRALTAEWRRKAIFLGVPAAAAVLACMALTAMQVGYWTDTITLYRHAAEVTEDNFVMRQYLGGALAAQGDFAEAAANFREAVRIRPDVWVFHSDLAEALYRQGRVADAIPEYREAARLQPGSWAARNSLGKCLVIQGACIEAAMELEAALRINPDNAETHNNLGAAYISLGRPAEAISQFEQALRIQPDYAEAHTNIAAALMGQTNTAAAVKHLREALRLEPMNPDAHMNMGSFFGTKGNFVEAAKCFRDAIRLKPDLARAHYYLGKTLASGGDPAGAVGEFRMAVRLKSDDLRACLDLAWLRATHPDPRIRDAREAVAAAEQAFRIAGQREPGCLDVLGAAYAEAGRYPEAAKVAAAAIALAESQGRKDLADRFRQREKLYRANQPYREPQQPPPTK